MRRGTKHPMVRVKGKQTYKSNARLDDVSQTSCTGQAHYRGSYHTRTNRRQQMTSKSGRCFLSLLLLRLTFDNYFAVAWSTAGLLRWAACLWRDDVYLWAFVICQLWSVCFLQVQAGTDGGISWAVLLGVGCFSESSGQLFPHQFVHVHTGANRRLFCEITTTSKRSSLTGRSVFTTIQAVPSRRCCVPSKGTEVSRIG